MEWGKANSFPRNCYKKVWGVYFLQKNTNHVEQNRRCEGCSKLKSSVDTTSSGMNGLNISKNWDRGQDQVSGGVSILKYI